MEDHVARMMALAMGSRLGGATPEDMKAAARAMGVDLGSFGAPRSKQQILQQHDRALQHMHQSLRSQKYRIDVSTALDIKPADDFPRPPALSSLNPIHAADLTPQTTHRGRVLRGTLVVDAVFMTGIHSVLEDEQGDVVRVSFYNTPQLRGLDSMARCLAAAQRVFKKGQVVAILEPYLKIAADGAPGVRVDNPAEVVFLDSLAVDPASLQQQGNAHFAASQFQEAASCYDRALMGLQQQGQQPGGPADESPCQLLLPVLLNLSATHLKLQQPVQALLHGAAAACVSCHGSSKAYYRAALALDSLVSSSSGGGSSGSSGTAGGNNISTARLAAAAVAIMDTAAQLLGTGSAEAKAQLRSALVNAPAAAAGAAGAASSKKQRKGNARGRSSKGANSGHADDDRDSGQEWRWVALTLAAEFSLLQDCFTGGPAVNAASSNSSSAEGAGREAAQHKAAGNEAFKREQYAAALQHYAAAFAALRASCGPSLPVLLSNRAACWLNLPGKHMQQHAVLDALAAALLSPEAGPKPYYRAATALMQLGDLVGAAAVCGLGLQLLPGEDVLQQLAQRIRQATAAAEVPEAGSSSSSEAGSSKAGKGSRSGRSGAAASSSSSSSRGGMKVLTEEEVVALKNKGAVQVEQVSMFNQLMGMMGHMAAAGGLQLKPGKRMPLLLDDRVPPFHEEFAKAGRWLPQMDRDKGMRTLWDAYEAARALPMHMLALTRKQGIEPQHLLQRLGTTDTASLREHIHAPWGRVRFPPAHLLKYGGPWQSFCNAPARKELLTMGTTHVAIGFVDLGGLAASCQLLVEVDPRVAAAAAAAAATAAGGSGSSSQAAVTPAGSRELRPLRWVGYEASAYCVVKTLVLLQMMRQGAAVEQVLQVWYSAAWSNSTVAAFRKAVTQLLSAALQATAATSQQPQQPNATLRHPQVLSLLRKWEVQHVPLATARSGWAAGQDHACSWIANFRRKADRLALCQLLLSGEVPHLGPADVGSVAMFAVPAEFGARAYDENFLQTLPYLTLMEACGQQPNSDIVAVAVKLLCGRTTHLSALLRAGLVLPEVHLSTVELANQATVAAIRALSPYTISWSNVPDYMGPAQFHRLARAISAPEDTVHFMHSMNWVLHTKGASHLDLILDAAEAELEEKLHDIHKDSQEAISEGVKALGMGKLLLCPPVDNPRNVMDYALFFVQYQVVESPQYAPPSRTNSTVHVTFTYDPNINWTPVTPASS